MIKFFTSLNVWVYRLTRGRLGSRMGHQSVLLLNTVGRRTGKHHTTSLSYYRDGTNYLLVASNWGKETQPAWYHNLIHAPNTTIQVKDKIIPVNAHPANDGDYQRLWQLVTRQNGQYMHYQANITRRIPIVILTPI